MSEGPLIRYRKLIASGALRDDQIQRAALEKLQLLHMRLKDYDPWNRKRVARGFFGWGREAAKTDADVNGLYMYGGVGRGKSMVMDLFYDCTDFPRKRRVHFHAFMQEVHAAIHKARQAGDDDPIKTVAKAIAKDVYLLCFDEMQITDITDAMIVGRLFEKMFKRGVVVVTTSNRAPDELYKDGLNRQLFLPFIEELKSRLDLFILDSPTDYRQARMKGAEVYHAPLDDDADTAMREHWRSLTGAAEGAPLELTVNGRRIAIPRFHNGVGRASFEDLCAKPMGAGDFLAIAAAVNTLLIDRIPRLGVTNANEARRFITLVDALYEARRPLICSAEAEPDELYLKGDGSFEFERTASRLAEMRSADYAAAA